MSATPAAATPTAAAPPAPATKIPWVGLTGVLLGTFISTLNTRLSQFGLADIRGAVHAGFDDGAWITTAQTAAQMLVTPFVLWLGSVYGSRRVLLVAAIVFLIPSILQPLSTDLPTFLVFQVVSGLATGCFI